MNRRIVMEVVSAAEKVSDIVVQGNALERRFVRYLEMMSRAIHSQRTWLDFS